MDQEEAGHERQNSSWRVGGVSLLVLGVLASPTLSADPTSSDYRDRSAQDLVQAALQAEVSGRAEERDVLLGQAVSKDPSYAPARWHSGYVSADGQWISVEEVQRRAAADPRLAEYRRLREVQVGTPRGELALARWCKQNGLDDQARFHWKRVLLFQPQNLEALKSLGVQWFQGRLLTPEEIQQAKADRAQLAKDRARYRTETKRWQKHWESQLTQWRDAAKRGDASLGSSVRKELDAVDFSSPVLASAAINTLHAVVLERSGTDKDQDALRQVGLALIKALDAVMEPAATHSMIVYSVDHPIAEVRVAAADALKKRPKETYVPWLLARMVSPIESSYAIVVLPGGGVIYEHSFFREGAEADFRDLRTERRSLGLPPQALSGAVLGQSNTPDGVRRRGETLAQAYNESRRSQAAAALKAIQIEREVERHNAIATEMNDRLGEALSRATGVDLPGDAVSSPNGWRDYWCQQYELQTPEGGPGGKPVYETWSYRAEGPLVQHSCFPCGTMVWTLTGPSAIENIKPGDQVLAQNPRSGELAFKPVLAPTELKPSERIKIGLGSDTITATRGHPFWVCGEGWKMAKELKAGQRLHTVSGAATIDGLAQLPPAERWETADNLSYNLIVDDFHTYFVGEQKVLVHDILYSFDAPTGPLPGLARR